MNEITMPVLSDLHVHLRQNDMMARVVPYTDRCCGYALVMPNINPPVTSVERLNQYRQSLYFNRTHPLFTFKVLPSCTPELVKAMHTAGVVAGKIYPEGVTTNSEDGLSREHLLHLSPTLLDSFAEMERRGMKLCLHGELPGEFCLDREEAFASVASKIVGFFPKLHVVWEHLTSAKAVQWVKDVAKAGYPVAGTITLHHLYLTLDDVIGDKIKCHNFCKPIAKRPPDRDALVAAALSGNPCFFLGSDSAPHEIAAKETACGCAGVFTAPVLPEMLADFFVTHDALEKMPAFVANSGNAFYGLPAVDGTLRLKQEEWTVPAEFAGVVPFSAGERLRWRLVG